MDDIEAVGLGLAGLLLGLAVTTKTGRSILQGAMTGYQIALVPATHPCRHPIIETYKNKKALPRCVVCKSELVGFTKGKDLNRKGRK